MLLRQPEPQRNLVMQVCQSTGLNVQFAIDCLGGNSWDLEKAIVNFNQVKVRDILLGRSDAIADIICRRHYPGKPSCRIYAFYGGHVRCQHASRCLRKGRLEAGRYASSIISGSVPHWSSTINDIAFFLTECSVRVILSNAVSSSLPAPRSSVSSSSLSSLRRTIHV